MVKKIRLDFSKVEERSGWNTRHIPEGLHSMKIEAVQETEAQDGTDMLVYALVPTEGKYKTRRFPFYCKLQQNQLWKLRDLFVAAGIPVPKKVQQLDPAKVVGKVIAAEATDETGQYEGRSSIQATYPLDILDDTDAPSDEDEDEEYDEDEVDEDDEVEEDEEEDDEEDLETLTLPELRKLAKSLGIDHTGLKKADLIESIEEEQAGADEDDEDEDDLDDEDLEDEELEDEEFEDDEEEEEEPAPAPRRKAPARKPAAKAAPKRTVRRR